MSHGPESHHDHDDAPHEVVERTPIEDPGDDYEPISANGYTTTHRAYDGSFYTVHNNSPQQAIARFETEEAFNNVIVIDQARQAAVPAIRESLSKKEGLYRVDSTGTYTTYDANDTHHEDPILGFIRPAAPTAAFIQKLTTTGFATDFHGVTKNEQYKNTLSLAPGEKDAIDAHGAAIVAAQAAQDSALVEGKTVMEAQAIGSQAFLDQEAKESEQAEQEHELSKLRGAELLNAYDTLKLYGTLQHTTEDSKSTPPDLTPGSDKVPPSQGASEELSSKEKSRTKPVKQFLKEIGHSVIFRAKLNHRGAVPLEAHTTVHKAGDLKDAIDEKVSETLTKFDAADEKYSDIARDVIENLPFLTSLALEQGAKELLMKIDLSLDHMTAAIENGAEKSKQFTIDQYKKAVEKLREQRERVITAILDLYDKVIAKRMRIWKRTSPIYNARADSRIKELKDYLATKHPTNPKYQS